MEELIKLDAYPIRGLVGRLLQDKTTRKNILFASDSYAGYGAGYRDDSQMTEGVLLGFDSCDIQPRVYKAAAEQTERTRKRAEVFTPAWIVNQMNNHCDAEWFGRADVFNHQEGQVWTVSTEPVTFPEGKDWKQYVDSRRLEITCGEAPYIVSRYDTSTGEIIPIERRIGILDRKLRIVNENAADEAEWFKWAFRAFQSVYGYEYQGDNLLIARMNLLYTLADYIEAKWHRQATQKELEKFLNVICWNLWQMDGLNDTPPYGIPSDEVVQMSLFDDEEETADDEIVYCKIYDWRKDISKLFKSLKKRGKGMKFDYVIGNPPYQEDTGGGSAANVAAKQARPVYNLFVDQAKTMQPHYISMIMPARWYAGGIGLNDFRNEMLNDPHLIRLTDFVNSKDCFSTVDIAGGICYFLWDRDKEEVCEVTNVSGLERHTMRRNLNEFGEIFIRSNESLSIIHKVLSRSEHFLTDRVQPIDAFGFPSAARGEKEPFDGCISLIHSQGTGYIKRSDVKKNAELIDKYKATISILVPCNGEVGIDPSKGYKAITTPRIEVPGEVNTFSYLVLGAFDTEAEIKNYKQYLMCKFTRFMLRLTYSSMHIARANFVFVPDQDFTEEWTDEKLYKKYELTEDEVGIIETTMRPMMER